MKGLGPVRPPNMAQSMPSILSLRSMCSSNGSKETISGIDTIVLALGATADSCLAQQIDGKVNEIYAIGDAECPSNATEAIAAGARVGRSI